MQRHQFLYLDEMGLAILHKELYQTHAWAKKEIQSLPTSPPIPAILRRQQAPTPGMVEVGFSLPMLYDGVRVRAFAPVPLGCIQNSLSPFAIVVHACTSQSIPGNILSALVEKGQRTGLHIGLFGSCALQALTGLPYLHPHSDWDILLAAHTPAPRLQAFAHELALLEKETELRFDCEILCNGGYGVKLRELLGTQGTVLGKSLLDVALLPRGSLTFIAE